MNKIISVLYHFYQNIFGNLLYSIELLVRSTNYSLAEKAAIINNSTSTQLARGGIPVVNI